MALRRYLAHWHYNSEIKLSRAAVNTPAQQTAFLGDFWDNDAWQGSILHTPDREAVAFEVVVTRDVGVGVVDASYPDFTTNQLPRKISIHITFKPTLNVTSV